MMNLIEGGDMLKSLILCVALIGQTPFADGLNRLADEIRETREAQERKERVEKGIEIGVVVAIMVLGFGLFALAKRRDEG